jgi:hypothetical protein
VSTNVSPSPLYPTPRLRLPFEPAGASRAAQENHSLQPVISLVRTKLLCSSRSSRDQQSPDRVSRPWVEQEHSSQHQTLSSSSRPAKIPSSFSPLASLFRLPQR